ncbi:hypothetical protein PHYBOEH_009391 [Phytophthora boehmeriae]|uniref:Uncharacterized protein n=1 Tax=Phytophthora boehmeriae TaxID=109152 RepID=A0A8T1X063_9STRA|nr:hypothetical protein PHYBOEH_009391 [Phytophthora boehmeriae]
MARAEDDELRPRGSSRGRPRSRPPTSVAEMYAQPTASSEQIAARPQRSSKMKMASLMAVVDENDVGPEENQKNKRVKTDGWEERSVPMSISSLTARNEPVGPGPVSGTGTRFSLTDETRPAPNASSLFQEVPNMIQSFADERRREGSNRKNGVAANGDTSPPATAKSVYEFYFPTMKADTTGTSSGRSLKRKRRSGRRGDDHGASDLDLLRFGVDAANLVPQGLVDRVDVHMSRAVLATRVYRFTSATNAGENARKNAEGGGVRFDH